MQIKQSRYRGNIYGLRAEARWAVFMSVLGIKFEHEPETFLLASGHEFTPTFFLPSQNKHITVMRSRPDLYCPARLEQWSRFSRELEDTSRSVLFVGPLPDWGELGESGYGKDIGPVYETGVDGIHLVNDSYHQWTRCRGCGSFGIQYQARGGRVACGCEYQRRIGDKDRNGNDPAIVYAYRYAKEYSFSQRGAK